MTDKEINKISNKIQIVDYETCWKENIDILNHILAKAVLMKNTGAMERIRYMLKALMDIEERHTKDEIVQ